MTNTFQRFEDLSPRLQRRSRSLAHTCNEHTADDLYQDMAVSYLVRTQRQPEFASQTDAYIFTDLTWDAQNVAEKGRTYNRYMDSEHIFSDDEGDEVSSFELIASGEPNPEDSYIDTEAIEALSAAILTLTPENQQIVKMIYLGYSQVEIAAQLGVSKPAITQRKATIEKALLQALSQPAPSAAL